MRSEEKGLLCWVLAFARYFLLCFTVAYLIMAKREFDEVTVNQILFHMQLMKDNIVTMPGDFIHVFFWHVRNALLCAVTLAILSQAELHVSGRRRRILLTAVLTALAAAWFIVPGKFIDDIFVWVRGGFLLAIVLAACLVWGRLEGSADAVRRFCCRITSGRWLALIWIGITAYSLYYINFATYFREQAVFGDFYTEGDYVAPGSVKVSGEGKKDLLIIYCESIEETFGREDLMGSDLLAPVRPYIEHPDLHIEQMPGADFTIGGIVSSQCGIPLKSISILSGNLTGWALERYLPGAVCLGDYLKDAGYWNVYYNGSSGLFSGLNKFFLSHGYQEFMGKEDWLEKKGVDPSSLNTWALYDQDMVDRSIERINELRKSGKRFSFALSTMDTHEPGFLSPECRGREDASWPGYIRCSMSQVARLLRHVREKGWEKDFVILVMGDHATRMPELGGADLKHASGRYVLCSLRSDGGLVPMRGVISHFDLFPTLLHALGFTVEGGRLGFGYDAYSRDAVPDEGRMERLKRRVLSHSKTYERLWLPDYVK